MTYNVNDAFLADHIYKTDSMNNGDVLISPDGTRWVLVLQSPDRKDGYQGALFRNASTGSFTFASRGTELSREPGKDLLADLQMGRQLIPDQMVSQRLFFRDVRDYVRQENANPLSITLVGDSLGGSLVTLLGAENPHNPVVAFNPYGVANLAPEGSFHNVTTHLFARDPVSVLPGSRMAGHTLVYNEPDNPQGLTDPALSSHKQRNLWLDVLMQAPARGH